MPTGPMETRNGVAGDPEAYAGDPAAHSAGDPAAQVAGAHRLGYLEGRRVGELHAAELAAQLRELEHSQALRLGELMLDVLRQRRWPQARALLGELAGCWRARRF